jgi:hypothetical protein
MINKRLLAILMATIMSSLTAGFICYQCKLNGTQAIQIFKLYAFLIGGLCGAYQGAQSFTDTKKLNKGEK